ncbi:hypothetical protein ZPR_2852 [Zunongwangia profunda SM-A87]|uniref:Uncharacterized protein n=1 Tax=Zunongwangia profunda (strain DSM 18752 / CCTCC AB 206139 / SM-A87) TaxID=655815 RepID=D5BG59_ZUNPS|nr:hypothetical protein ZPR_2852 [Zunongwangia profunda SM-A87]
MPPNRLSKLLRKLKLQSILFVIFWYYLDFTMLFDLKSQPES